MTIFVIHNCYMDKTNLGLIQQAQLFVDLEVPTIRLHTSTLL